MGTWVKCSDATGDVRVNLDLVLSYYKSPEGKGTVLIFANGAEMTVDETPDQVAYQLDAKK